MKIFSRVEALLKLELNKGLQPDVYSLYGRRMTPVLGLLGLIGYLYVRSDNEEFNPFVSLLVAFVALIAYELYRFKNLYPVTYGTLQGVVGFALTFVNIVTPPGRLTVNERLVLIGSTIWILAKAFESIFGKPSEETRIQH